MANRGGELLLDVFALAITAQVGIVLLGRALNSPTAYRLSPIPIVGNTTGALRAFVDQTYDPATEAPRS